MAIDLARRRTGAHKPFLAWICAVALGWVIVVFQAGGFTTSINAGMAFLDWPLSDGSLNPADWLTDPEKRAEHSHRLSAAVIGLLTIVIAVALFLYEERRWLRYVGLAAAVLVVLQGVMGGMRVLFDPLNTGAGHDLVATTYRVAHGIVAQIFVCVLVVLALASSRRWIEQDGGLQRPPSGVLRTAGIGACVAVVVQLILGAIMRHNDAALAIPTFPLAREGSVLPAQWSFPVAIHFAHRAGAVVVTAALMLFAGRLWAARHQGRVLGAGALVLTGTLAVQIFLGALIVWTKRNPHAATMHVLVGVFLLATCWGLTFLCHRFRFGDAGARVHPAPAAASRPATASARA